jgi:hypothetical protein
MRLFRPRVVDKLRMVSEELPGILSIGMCMAVDLVAMVLVVGQRSINLPEPVSDRGTR